MGIRIPPFKFRNLRDIDWSTFASGTPVPKYNSATGKIEGVATTAVGSTTSFASEAEVLAGTVNNKAVAPDTLQAKIDAIPPSVTVTDIISNELQRITLTNVPADRFLAFTIDSGVTVGLWKATDSNGTIGTAAETAFGNTTITASKSLTTSVDSDSGETLYSGTIDLTFTGNLAETNVTQVQVITGAWHRYIVTGGDTDADYGYNGSAGAALGFNEAAFQTALRATGGDFANCVSKGVSTAPVAGGNTVSVSGFPGGLAGVNGTYTENGTQNGARQFRQLTGDQNYIYWSGSQWEIGPDNVGSTYSSNTGGNINGWAGAWSPYGPTVSDIPSAGTDGEAYFNIYFPIAAGTVALGTAAGTGASRSEIAVGLADASTAAVESTVTAGAADVGDLVEDVAIKVLSLSDSNAPNSTLYYSTTQSKLVWKDSGGTVRNLY